MKRLFIFLSAFLMLSINCMAVPSTSKKQIPSQVTLSKETLMDKIKGAWAGQVIGCTYGGPT